MTGQQSISYKERAAYYDVEYVDDVDSAFLSSMVTDEVKSILEIPCGVGRNVVRLAHTGKSIVAADIEPEMVLELSDRLRQVSADNVRPIVADLRTLALDQQFDLILVPREAFQLVTDREEAFSSLLCLGRHLAPGGRLMIDLSPFSDVRDEQSNLRPDYFDASLPDGIWIEEWSRPTKNGAVLSRARMQFHNEGSTVGVTFKFTLTSNASTDVREAKIGLRVYSRHEFEENCRSAGLKVEAVFGDYQKSPHKTGDARMIFLLSRGDNLDKDAPPSGVLWDVVRNFSNDRDSFHTKNIASVTQRPAVREYFEKYLSEYFSGPFLPGYGAEEILQTMSKWAGSGNALDLGAATTSLFWYLPATNITRQSCCDIAPEALAVFDHFIRHRHPLPECYQWVINHFGLTETMVEAAKQRIDEYLVFDCISQWPVWMQKRNYDLITAFGNFGISRDAEMYQQCFRNLTMNLNPGGRAIGADWVRRASFVEREGHDNGYLSVEMIMQTMKSTELTPVSCMRVELSDDPLYGSVIVWAGLASD
jgi:SAM-dependent methyltransferase